MPASCRHGFTLIELSIVLVIIGLLVGGILVGRALIHAAEVRAQIAQIEKYNTAANTFRLKYGGLPGDLPVDQAAAFGFFVIVRNLDEPWGNGDGFIISNADGSLSYLVGESGLFWIHLSEAGLIAEGDIGNTGDECFFNSNSWGAMPPIPADCTAPRAKLGRDNHIYIYAGPDAPDALEDIRLYGQNYFHIFPYTGVENDGYIYASENGITPIEAYSIDSKMDDGRPNSGKIVARAAGEGYVGGNPGAFPNRAPSAAATSTSDKCNIGDGLSPTDTYNVVEATGGNKPSCSLRIRASF